MSLQSQRAKDAAMAARLKADGVKRTHAACPICHHRVNLNALSSHIISCRGR